MIPEQRALPDGYTEKDGKVYDRHGAWVELFEGRWLRVLQPHRTGWWRFHEHYDRDVGYCDNPARGY
jgi:hypothetical protein